MGTLEQIQELVRINSGTPEQAAKAIMHTFVPVLRKDLPQVGTITIHGRPILSVEEAKDAACKAVATWQYVESLHAKADAAERKAEADFERRAEDAEAKLERVLHVISEPYAEYVSIHAIAAILKDKP